MVRNCEDADGEQVDSVFGFQETWRRRNAASGSGRSRGWNGRNYILDQSTIGSFVGAKSLADTLRPPTVLSKLSVDNCKLGDKGTEALCSTLALNNVPRELSLCGNSIGKVGTKALAGVLKSNATLETLRLGSNNLGNCVKYLTEALRSSQTTALQSLQPSGNGVTDEGAEALAQCLESNAVLRVLELWNNRIDCKGAIALASSIMVHNRVLEKLNVNGNRIGVSGVAALTTVLLAHCSLKFLHLKGNPGRTRQQRPTRVVIGANEDTLSGQPEPQAPSLEYIPLGDPRFGPSINTRAGHSVGDIYDIRNDVRLRIVPLVLFSDTVHLQIAHSSFGTVFNAINRRTHRAVAIKVGNPTILDHNDAYQAGDRIRDFASMGKYCQEIYSLKRLRESHSSLLHMEEFYVENGSFYIVSEPMGSSLGHWRANVSHFSEDMAREIARSLHAGLAYMHAHHVIHRDIKPSNILFGHDGDIPSLKIIDFGLSRSLKPDNEWRRTFVGSLGYIA